MSKVLTEDHGLMQVSICLGPSDGRHDVGAVSCGGRGCVGRVCVGDKEVKVIDAVKCFGVEWKSRGGHD